MTLCDTGPLIALIDRSDAGFDKCVLALPTLTPPLITTWPCLTEAMYLLGTYGGYMAQDELWSFFDNNALVLHVNCEDERIRMHELMIKYRDVPMDLADASLVAAAEILNLKHIFTLDSHFYAYRLKGKQVFEVLP